jgi:hypothetical protein
MVALCFASLTGQSSTRNEVHLAPNLFFEFESAVGPAEICFRGCFWVFVGARTHSVGARIHNRDQRVTDATKCLTLIRIFAADVYFVVRSEPPIPPIHGQLSLPSPAALMAVRCSPPLKEAVKKLRDTNITWTNTRTVTTGQTSTTENSKSPAQDGSVVYFRCHVP